MRRQQFQLLALAVVSINCYRLMLGAEPSDSEDASAAGPTAALQANGEAIIREFVGAVDYFMVSPDGTALVTVAEGTALVWSVQTGANLGSVAIDATERLLAVSPLGDLLLSTDECEARVRETTTGEVTGRLGLGDLCSEVGATFAPSGDRFAVFCAWTTNLVEGELLLASGAAGVLDHRLHAPGVSDVAFTPDAGLVYAACVPEGTLIVDAASGRTLGALPHPQYRTWHVNVYPVPLDVAHLPVRMSVDTDLRVHVLYEFGLARQWRSSDKQFNTTPVDLYALGVSMHDVVMSADGSTLIASSGEQLLLEQIGTQDVEVHQIGGTIGQVESHPTAPQQVFVSLEPIS